MLVSWHDTSPARNARQIDGRAPYRLHRQAVLLGRRVFHRRQSACRPFEALARRSCRRARAAGSGVVGRSSGQVGHDRHYGGGDDDQSGDAARGLGRAFAMYPETVTAAFARASQCMSTLPANMSPVTEPMSRFDPQPSRGTEASRLIRDPPTSG
jgi:hypothetical protein